MAHLAELDTRRAIHAAEGYGSLFSYCTRALRLSEDAACNRIEAARACRRFPVIPDLLASGAVMLTAIRILGRSLGMLRTFKGIQDRASVHLPGDLAPHRL